MPANPQNEKEGGTTLRKPIRALLALLLPAIVTIAFAASTLAVGPQGKVDICHWANHKYVEINVSANAMPAHMGHGDVLPDEYGDCP